MTSPRPASALTGALTSLLAALTTWTAMLSWRPLTADPGFTTPLLICCLLVAAVGFWGRWSSWPRVLVPVVQLLATLPVALLWLHGTPFPTPDALGELSREISEGITGAQRYAAPVPSSSSLTALFLLAGVAGAVTVDLLALGLRRVPASGLVLLLLHVVPANLGVETAWFDFALMAICFLMLLHLVQVDSFVRWDQGGGTATPSPDENGTDAEGRADEFTFASTPAAATISVAAVGLALVVASALPLSKVSVWDGPGSGNGSDGVSLGNPLVDMRRDLSRGWDMPLVRVRGENRRPVYLRLAALNNFNGREWTSGNRTAPESQMAGGQLPSPIGLDESVPTRTYAWTFTASESFQSRWLPTPSQVDSVRAPGDWRYDLQTRDFVAWDRDLTTAGLSWSATELVPQLDAEMLDAAPGGRGPVGTTFTQLPKTLPSAVEEMAQQVAGDEPTSFRQARALQSWFRTQFTYSLDRVESVGNDDLVDFLSPGGRTGYCEQFAAAMAVMARTLGIPARVVVGFLEPEKVAPSTWVFSAHDLHAWPELFFPGAGWVRFEPTPASRTPGAPAYSTDELPVTDSPDLDPSSGAVPSAPQDRPDTAGRRDAAKEDAARADESFPWQRTLVGLAGAMVLGGVVLAPGLLRRRRRAARLASTDVDAWWLELRDTAIDLGCAWPTGRSPRESGAWLSDHLADRLPVETDDRPNARHPATDRAGSVSVLTPVRPLDTRDTVSHVVAAVEAARYGRGAVPDESVRGDVVRTLEALGRRASGRRRLLAAWVPRSLWS